MFSGGRGRKFKSCHPDHVSLPAAQFCIQRRAASAAFKQALWPFFSSESLYSVSSAVISAMCQSTPLGSHK